MSRPDQSTPDGQSPIAQTVAADSAFTRNIVWRWLTAHAGVNAEITVFCLMFIGAIWTAVIISAQSKRADTIASVFRQNSNLAIAYEEQTIRTLKGVDAVARFIAHEYRRLGTRVDLARDIKDGLIDANLFTIVSVINESGDLVLSSKATGPFNYADRDHFRFHVLHDTGEIFIGKPVLGRISGTWQIPMTRRINRPDGSFGGVVVLAVNPAYFTAFYQKADLGKNGIVNLVGLDGISRARRAAGNVSSGVDMSKSDLFKEQSIRKIGSMRGPGAVEQVPRLISYRTLAEYPLVVAVGTAEEEVLAPYLRERNKEYFAALLFTAVIVLFGALLTVALTRQRRAVTALVDSVEQFRATFEQAAVGISHTSLARRFLRVNQKFCDMLGYTREELLEIRPRDLTHHDDRDAYNDLQARLVAGEIDTFASEGRLIHKNGSAIWVNRTVSLVRDSAGAPLYFIRVIEDISGRKQVQEQVTYFAQYDSLTALPNRALFRDRLSSAIARARRQDHQVVLIFLDLDRFKEVNDALGHTAGDEVLQAAAGLLKASLRETDTIARLGGDEFTVILENVAQLKDVVTVAEKLKQAFAGSLTIHGREVTISISMGIALYPHDGTDVEALLKAADIAMYEAKKAGRNTYEFYAPAMNAVADDRLEMAALLRHALERQEFVLHYQPKVETASGKVVGVEALVRWNSSERGLVAPADFIALAEQTGLIVPIGEWVLETACAQSMAWQARGLPPLLMSVNLSARQLREKNLAGVVAAALKDSGLQPALLELEITETAIMENIHQNVAILRALQQPGVKIAIADFGSGQSSLAHLTKLPVHALKIDRSFIVDMLKDANSMLLVSTILTLARSLGLKVIAEGVETAEQEKLLRLLRCDEIQGDLISPPLPASGLAFFLGQAPRRDAATSVQNKDAIGGEVIAP
jgi:diguanylate cyclase (GGDEF)-like protein/PAS domain S-box-containing protein